MHKDSNECCSLTLSYAMDHHFFHCWRCISLNLNSQDDVLHMVLFCLSLINVCHSFSANQYAVIFSIWKKYGLPGLWYILSLVPGVLPAVGKLKNPLYHFSKKLSKRTAIIGPKYSLLKFPGWGGWQTDSMKCFLNLDVVQNAPIQSTYITPARSNLWRRQPSCLGVEGGNYLFLFSISP